MGFWHRMRNATADSYDTVRSAKIHIPENHPAIRNADPTRYVGGLLTLEGYRLEDTVLDWDIYRKLDAGSTISVRREEVAAIHAPHDIARSDLEEELGIADAVLDARRSRRADLAFAGWTVGGLAATLFLPVIATDAVEYAVGTGYAAALAYAGTLIGIPVSSTIAHRMVSDRNLPEIPGDMHWRNYGLSALPAKVRGEVMMNPGSASFWATD